MENATDAIIMAASVLLLIIALTVSISSFSTLKSQTQEIISARDQLQLTTDNSGEFLNYLKNDNELRVVGADTIITTLRRLRKEDYTMYIYPKNQSDLSTIDLTSEQKKSIIINVDDSSIVEYRGVPIISAGNQIIRLRIAGDTNKYIEDDKIINAIYKLTQGKQYKEYNGIYQIASPDDEDDEYSETETSSVNKKTYKIITFVEI